MNAEKHFGTSELYGILGLEPYASINDGNRDINLKMSVFSSNDC